MRYTLLIQLREADIHGKATPSGVDVRRTIRATDKADAERQARFIADTLQKGEYKRYSVVSDIFATLVTHEDAEPEDEDDEG